MILTNKWIQNILQALVLVHILVDSQSTGLEPGFQNTSLNVINLKYDFLFKLMLNFMFYIWGYCRSIIGISGRFL